MPNDATDMRDALIRLHDGADRLGPGDNQFSLEVMRALPKLFPKSIADLGCGTGAVSLLLAEQFQQSVLCVDTSEAFLATLRARAEAAGLDRLITPLCQDMGDLDPRTYRFDLLWSEGAAYNLTFLGAMQKWRPLMLTGGIAVISELSWYHRDQPPEAYEYWSAAYPQMGTETVNQAIAEQYRFKLLSKERLPSEAWWKNYYTPLANRLEALAGSSEAMDAAITETRKEMQLFSRYSDDFGYTFYVLEAV